MTDTIAEIDRCDFAEEGAVRELCLMVADLQAAQSASPSRVVWPWGLENYTAWAEPVFWTVLFVLLLAALIVYRKRIGAFIARLSGLTIGKDGVEITLADLQSAVRTSANAGIDLTEEVLNLTDYIDRILVLGDYEEGAFFEPPTVEQSSQSIAAHRAALAEQVKIPGIETLPGGVQDALRGFLKTGAVGLMQDGRALPSHPLAGNAAPGRIERQLRILWVDDRADLVAFERQAMTRIGHEVVALTDVEAARKRITEEDFDLIVTDSARDDDPGAWRRIRAAARDKDTQKARNAPGKRTPLVVFTTFKKAEAINGDTAVGGDSEAFATHSFAQLRWRARWLERRLKERDATRRAWP